MVQSLLGGVPTRQWIPICGSGGKENFERKSKLVEGVGLIQIKERRIRQT